MTAARLAEQALELAAILAAPRQTPADHLKALERIGRLRRTVDALGCEVAGEVERLSSRDLDSPLARGQGEKSAAVLVEVHAGIGSREARAWCRVGAVLQPRVSLVGEVLAPDHPALRQAIGEGSVSVLAADRILMTLDAVAPFTSRDHLEQVESFLIEHAPQLTERQFGLLCRAVPDRFDQDGAEPREDLLREKSGVRVLTTREGLTRWIVTHASRSGGIPRLSHSMRARLHDVSRPSRLLPPEDAERVPLHQARLEALVSIARESPPTRPRAGCGHRGDHDGHRRPRDPANRIGQRQDRRHRRADLCRDCPASRLRCGDHPSGARW